VVGSGNSLPRRSGNSRAEDSAPLPRSAEEDSSKASGRRLSAEEEARSVNRSSSREDSAGRRRRRSEEGGRRSDKPASPSEEVEARRSAARAPPRAVRVLLAIRPDRLCFYLYSSVLANVPSPYLFFYCIIIFTASLFGGTTQQPSAFGSTAGGGGFGSSSTGGPSLFGGVTSTPASGGGGGIFSTSTTAANTTPFGGGGGGFGSTTGKDQEQHGRIADLFLLRRAISFRKFRKKQMLRWWGVSTHLFKQRGVRFSPLACISGFSKERVRSEEAEDSVLQRRHRGSVLPPLRRIFSEVRPRQDLSGSGPPLLRLRLAFSEPELSRNRACYSEGQRGNRGPGKGRR